MMMVGRFAKFFMLWSAIWIMAEGVRKGQKISSKLLSDYPGQSSRNCCLTFSCQEYGLPKHFFSIDGRLEPCMFWEDILPPSKSLEEELQENFCRNPGDFHEPYCFALNTSLVGKQSCQVPYCPELDENRITNEGWEFQGELDLKTERLCLTPCTPHTNLGLSCLINVPTAADSTGTASSQNLSKYIPCDVPLLQETPVFNTTYTKQINVFVSSLTWYIPVSDHEITHNASGEMMLQLPERTEVTDQPYRVEFRIRLADALEVRDFHLCIYFLAEDTFQDYYNLSFSTNGMEMQRITYTPTDLKTSKTGEDEKGNGALWVKKKVEFSYKYKRFPYLRLSYEWIPFVIEFRNTRVALYYQDDEENPALDMESMLSRIGGRQSKYSKYFIKGYFYPRFVSFQSLRGMGMVAIDKVNQAFYSCTEGRVKCYEDGHNTRMHPLAVMPTLYSHDENPLEKEQRSRTRKLCLQVVNIPAILLFTSSPVRNASDLQLLQKALTLHLEVGVNDMTVTRCGIVHRVNETWGVECADRTRWEHVVHFRRKVPSWGFVNLCFKNFLKRGKNIVEIYGSVPSVEKFKILVPHPAYLRYWTVLKKRPSGLTRLGPLSFRIFNSKTCPKKSYDNELMSSCLTGYYGADGKRDYPDYRENYVGHVSWSMTGKSCFSWYSFHNTPLTVYLEGNRTLQRNYCTYLSEQGPPTYTPPKMTLEELNNCSVYWPHLMRNKALISYWILMVHSEEHALRDMEELYCSDSSSFSNLKSVNKITRRSFLEDPFKTKLWILAVEFYNATGIHEITNFEDFFCNYRRVQEEDPFSASCKTVNDFVGFGSRLRLGLALKKTLSSTEESYTYCRFTEEIIPPKEKKEEIEEENWELGGFWCFVSLTGTKELCKIPPCADLGRSHGGCSWTQEYMLHHSSLMNKSEVVCNELVGAHFILDLNTPFSLEWGTRTRIFHPEERVTFHLRSYSSMQREPLCFHLYDTSVANPLVEFRIAHDSLSMGRYGQSHKSHKAVNPRELPRFTNVWSYNSYTISQSERAWNLFHGSNLKPSATFITTHQLEEIQLGHCSSFHWEEKGENKKLKGQLVTVHMSPLPAIEGLQEAVFFRADPPKKMFNMEQIDRLYFFGQRQKLSEVSVGLMILFVKEPLQFGIFLYETLPWPDANPVGEITITDQRITVSGLGSETRSHQVVAATAKFSELRITIKIDTGQSLVAVSFGEANIQTEMAMPRYYGLQIIKGALKLVRLSGDD